MYTLVAVSLQTIAEFTRIRTFSLRLVTQAIKILRTFSVPARISRKFCFLTRRLFLPFLRHSAHRSFDEPFTPPTPHLHSFSPVRAHLPLFSVRTSNILENVAEVRMWWRGGRFRNRRRFSTAGTAVPFACVLSSHLYNLYLTGDGSRKTREVYRERSKKETDTVSNPR